MYWYDQRPSYFLQYKFIQRWGACQCQILGNPRNLQMKSFRKNSLLVLFSSFRKFSSSICYQQRTGFYCSFIDGVLSTKGMRRLNQPLKLGMRWWKKSGGTNHSKPHCGHTVPSMKSVFRWVFFGAHSMFAPGSHVTEMEILNQFAFLHVIPPLDLYCSMYIDPQ